MAAKPTPKPRVRKSTAKPVPMPKVTPGGRTAKPKPAGPKKKKTLDDFLLKGKRPPLAPGQKKLPPDYDVIIKGFNDKNTIKKYKKK